MPQKAQAFAMDPYMRLASDAFAECFDETQFTAFAHRHAMIIFQPNAIAGRKVKTSLHFLRRQGFEPVHMRRIAYSRITSREEWRYQFSEITLARMKLASAKFMIGPSAICTTGITPPHVADDKPVLPAVPKIVGVIDRGVSAVPAPPCGGWLFGQLRSYPKRAQYV
ncbi:MAG: hypothetical protein ABI748_12845 [Dokdonella sp.]